MRRSNRWMISLAMVTVLSAACGAPDEDQVDLDEQQIVNGEKAEAGQYPWMAALINQAGSVFCGASVIDRRWLLTAAHCVKYGPPDVIEIGASKVNAKERGSVRIAKKNVRVHIHPKFYGGGVNDVALIELLTPLSESHEVIRFNRSVGGGAEQTPKNERPNARVIGYGYLKQGAGHTEKELYQVNVPLVDQKTCAASYPGRIFDYNICAGFKRGSKDSCSGDSGGPLFTLNGEEQVGIVSWGTGCAQPNKYGVYMRVSSFASWIKSVSGI